MGSHNLGMDGLCAMFSKKKITSLCLFLSSDGIMLLLDSEFQANDLAKCIARNARLFIVEQLIQIDIFIAGVPG